MRLSRPKRLTRSADFRRVRDKGRSQSGKFLVLGVLAEPSGSALQFGFITTKRLGPAVVRNLVRRRLRSIVSEIGSEISPGHLVVTVARPAAASASRETLLKEWRWLARRAGLLPASGSLPPPPPCAGSPAS
ncbi:MAG: ribonuclease P protein component [Verrucomicrobia bacterium]|nr:ribonuclease P protein component [Verrucomicrobiota bacterium]